MSLPELPTLSRFGPLVIERTATTTRGYVMTVHCGAQHVQISISPKGQSHMRVEHVLWSSRAEEHYEQLLKEGAE